MLFFVNKMKESDAVYRFQFCLIFDPNEDKGIACQIAKQNLQIRVIAPTNWSNSD
jgi:hypothetical protein